MANEILHTGMGIRQRVRDERREPDCVRRMQHGIGGDDPARKIGQSFIGVLGEEAMNDRADRLRKSLKRQLARCFDQRAAGRGNIVGEHRLTSAPRVEIGNLDINVAVAVPDLSEHGERRADACGDRGDPLLALFVRADQQRRIDVCRDPVGERRRGVERDVGDRVECRQRRVAMQGDEACPLGRGRNPVEVLANVLLAGDAHRLGPSSALMMVAPNSVSGVVMGWTRRGCRAAIVRPDAPHLPISRERSSPLPEGVMTARQQGNSARAPTEADRGG